MGIQGVVGNYADRVLARADSNKGMSKRFAALYPKWARWQVAKTTEHRSDDLFSHRILFESRVVKNTRLQRIEHSAPLAHAGRCPRVDRRRSRLRSAYARRLAGCQFAGHGLTLRNFRRVMGPSASQDDGATREGAAARFLRSQGPGSEATFAAAWDQSARAT